VARFYGLNVNCVSAWWRDQERATTFAPAELFLRVQKASPFDVGPLRSTRLRA
jgi:hypothetical protein